MFYYFHYLTNLFGPLRLFESITFRAVLAGLTAFAFCLIFAPAIIARLRQLKMKEVGRDISEIRDLATLHEGKKDTPTMGGLIIFVAITLGILLFARPNVYVMVSWLAYAGLTLVGFRDDYLKVMYGNSKGMAGRWKMFWQAVLALVILLILVIHPSTSGTVSQLWVPFYKHVLIESMPFWLLFAFFFLILSGSSNAINLTDGIDGLAIGCTVTSAMAFGLMAYFAGNSIISDYLLISYLPGTGELTVVCAAMLGAGLGFLWFNSHPADVFMGDTGSLALGGMIGTIAFLIHQPLTLIFVGGIFVIEVLSVMIQVFSVKTRGKRVFLMSPIHHHFELRGLHENKVVIRFWIISLLFAALGLALLRIR